jgi:Tol biopolymer transport system component
MAMVLLSSGCAYVARVSSVPSGGDAFGVNGSPSHSANGRYVAYAARSDSRFPGVDFGVYVLDNSTNKVELVSQSTGGDVANDWSGEPAITPDGRYVAFSSDADNLIADDGNLATDVFVRDRVSKTTVRVSLNDDGTETDDASYDPSISDDGRYVAFSSDSDAIVPDIDFNASTDVFVRDRTSNRTKLGDVQSGQSLDDGAYEPQISGNGQYLVFTTIDPFIAFDTNFDEDVYRRDLSTASSTARVTSGSGGSDGSISNDGRWVSFMTADPVAGTTTDPNNNVDVYVRDMSSSTRLLASVGPAGKTLNFPSLSGTITGDGRYVAFLSAANLTGTDTNGSKYDVFVRDLTTSRSYLVSTGSDLVTQVAQDSSSPGLSDDGRYTVFSSSGALLNTDTNAKPDFYLRTLVVPELTTISPTSAVRGTGVTLTVTGRNFRPGAQASIGFNFADSVTVNSETSLTMHVNLPANTPLGKADVYVENPGTGAGPNAGTVGACKQCLTVTG